MTELCNDADLLGDWNKKTRPKNAALRVPPPHQCFHAGNPPAIDRDLRLIHEKELAFIERDAQLRPKGDPALDFRVHRIGEEAVATTTL